MCRDFVGVLVVAGLSLIQVDITILLTFMEYLHINHIKVLTINNNISALRSSCKRFGLNLAPFEGHRITMFIKALKFDMPLSVKVTLFFYEGVILSIIQVSETLESPLVFTALYLLAFSPFLRLFYETGSL